MNQKIIKEFREKFGNNPLLQQSKQKDLYNVNQVVEQFLLKALKDQREELLKKIEGITVKHKAPRQR